MKRCGPWLFVGFVLAILLILGLGPVRPTCMFLDSLIGRASCLNVSRLSVSAAVLVKPAKFSLHLEARPARTNVFLCSLTYPSTMRRCAQMIPIRLGSISAGPSVGSNGPRG